MRSTPSLGSFPGAAFETVLMLIGLTMGLFPPVKQYRRALSLSVPSPPGDRCFHVVGFVPAGSA